MEYRNMNLKMEKYSKDVEYNREHMVILSNESKPCLICKKSTNYVDIHSHGHICSPECNVKFYEKVDSLSMDPDSPSFYPTES